jgi:hypothetical protein
MQKCIGAIDGAHIKARLSNKNSVPYQDRKSTTTQNAMCVIDYDIYFMYVCSGWEGSTHETRIFT